MTQSFIVHHSSFFIHHLSCIIHHHSSFIIHHSAFIIDHSAFIIRHSSFINQSTIDQKSIKHRSKINQNSIKNQPKSVLEPPGAVLEASKPSWRRPGSVLEGKVDFCSHSRTKSPFWPKMVISFESESMSKSNQEN